MVLHNRSIDCATKESTKMCKQNIVPSFYLYHQIPIFILFCILCPFSSFMTRHRIPRKIWWGITIHNRQYKRYNEVIHAQKMHKDGFVSIKCQKVILINGYYYLWVAIECSYDYHHMILKWLHNTSK